MKIILHYLKEFIRLDFNLKVYLYTVVFLCTAFIINYSLNLEDLMLGKYYGSIGGYVYHFISNTIMYFGIAIPQFIILKEKDKLLNKNFLLFAFSIITIISIQRGFYQYREWSEAITDIFAKKFFVQNVMQLKKVFIYIPLLLVLKIVLLRSEKDFWGSNIKNYYPRPYLLMIAIIAPLVILASFQPDFYKTYPRFKPWTYQEFWGLSKWQMTVIYEFIYGLNFYCVEILFRGALVFGIARFIGKNAILPMVAVYALFHFGKPMGEAISSVFGGYILGIFAYYSKNILGGLTAHLGIAYLMETCGFFQHYLR